MNELFETYSGVLCARCKQPIAVSANMAYRKAQLESEDSVGSRAFTLRCKHCCGENIYALRDIQTFEGLPPTRSSSAIHDRRVA
jgi:hypothetical protein